ncbi:hypothetical protein [Botrimarina colliarenosi]|uniref:hypothetical protein n=1 Tax=Botrimarina colliarenosi TaxID=2528001 RepID=UPI0011B68A7A|nr:hypothetical protein [Botrimarina colliarenosi]
MPETPPALTDAELAGREWPALRASIIDIAAALDRLDATGGSESARVRAEAEALLRTLLAAGDADRAERLLEQLSRPYDPAWRKRFAADNPDESL